MVKNNNAVPRNHFRKWWQRHVNVTFGRAMQDRKKAIMRNSKAMVVAPRPLKPLRPIVTCPSRVHNYRKRQGKGFTVREISEAGLEVVFAKTIGICVDRKRKDQSEESLNRNVARLRAYTSALVVAPRNPAKPVKGENTKEEMEKAKCGPYIRTFSVPGRKAL